MSEQITSPIPLIDLGSGEPIAVLGEKIKNAIASVGFLHVKGAGISQEDVNEMFQIHEKLFKSPADELNACPDEAMGGYYGFQKYNLAESKNGQGDFKESFVYGRYPPTETSCVQKLPPVLSENRKIVDAFHAKCFEATCTILDAFSVALNLPKEYFRNAQRPGQCALSLLNYPPLNKDQADLASAGGSRAGAHKDWGAVTLLFQEENGTPGLEIFLPNNRLDPPTKAYELSTEIDYSNGKWYKAPIIPGTFLVNIGSALEVWTGGRFKATLHQVSIPPRNPDGSTAGRRSIAFFNQPKEDVVFNPIEPDGSITVTPGALTSYEFYLERRNATKA